MAVTDYLRLRRVASLSVPNNVETAVSWDTEDADVSGYWTSGAATRITIPTGKQGIHLFTFNFELSAQSTFGAGWARIYNSSDALQRIHYGPLGVEEAAGHLTVVTKLAAGDYITLNVWQNTSAQNLTPAQLDVVRLA